MKLGLILLFYIKAVHLNLNIDLAQLKSHSEGKRQSAVMSQFNRQIRVCGGPNKLVTCICPKVLPSQSVVQQCEVGDAVERFTK